MVVHHFLHGLTQTAGQGNGAVVVWIWSILLRLMLRYLNRRRIDQIQTTTAPLPWPAVCVRPWREWWTTIVVHSVVHIVYYLESNNLITNLQSGFRKERIMVDQLIRLETWVREGLVNREHVFAIFFDHEKAYDTTWKYGILSGLFKAGSAGYSPKLYF